MFLVFKVLAFLAGKWRHEFAAKFLFFKTGDLMMSDDIIWKNFVQGSRNWRNVWNMSTHSRDTTFWNLDIVLFLATKCREIQSSKCHIFWVDSHFHISFRFCENRYRRRYSWSKSWREERKEDFLCYVWRYLLSDNYPSTTIRLWDQVKDLNSTALEMPYLEPGVQHSL